MLFQENGWKRDQDRKNQSSSFDGRMFQSFRMPGTETHTQGADHMQTGAYIGIGIESVEPGNDPGQDIIPCEFRNAEFLTGGVDQIEDKRTHEGNA